MFHNMLDATLFSETEDKNTPGEKEFNEAKVIWNTISKDVKEVIEALETGNLNELHEEKYKVVFPAFKNVISLLKQSTQNQHYEGTRCYAGLQLIAVVVRFHLYNRERNLTFSDLQRYWSQSKKYIQHIINVLDQPKFAQDEFSQGVLFHCSIIMVSVGNFDRTHTSDTNHKRLLNRLRNDRLYMAYSLIKAKEHNDNFLTLQQIFAADKMKAVKTIDGSAQISLLIFSCMLDESVLDETKKYSLEHGMKILQDLDHSFKNIPLTCDFFTIPPLRAQQMAEFGKLMQSLMDVAITIDSRSSTRLISQGLQQMPHVSSKPKHAEKPKEPPKEKPVTPNLSQPSHLVLVPAPKSEVTEPVRMITASPRR